MRVVAIDGGYETYAPEREALAEVGASLEVFEGGRDEIERKLAFAQGAAGLFVRWLRIDDAFFDAVPGVRAVLRYGVGYDNIDVPAATRRGVLVSNVQGYANHSVTDHALAMLMSCLRELRPGASKVAEDFTQPPRKDILELREVTLGIVGLGNIGATMGRRAGGLCGRVLAYDPFIEASRFGAAGAEQVDLDTLLARSDVISLHCNLTESSRGRARGPGVEGGALLAALDAGQVRAAGVDVFEVEPPGPAQAALLEHPRVIATGHYAWYSAASLLEVHRRAGANMAGLLRGELVADCLNPEAAGSR